LELCLGLRIVDLLITNTKMPGLSGPMLIQQVRQELPTLPILYVRNRGQLLASAPEGLPADVPTIAEPFTVDQLLDAVRPLLQQHGERPRPGEGRTA
jgi:DNA-binding response OmpR family regulator